MGMFAAEYKQHIPKYAKTVGIVTASTGAAIRDIMNISARRNPYVQLVLYPALVQGEQAKYSIVKGIQTLDRLGLDVIIVGRGGGSIEDLWAFNEEMVARVIFECSTPIISAVGHETDVTISDYVADMRAPTPSAAAELAVPDVYEVKQKIIDYENRLRNSLIKKVEIMKLRYQKVMASFVFKEPTRRIEENYLRMDHLLKQMENAIKEKQEKEKTRYSKLIAKLDAYSPLKTLARGYTITQKNGKVIKQAKELKKEDVIDIKFQDGQKQAKIM